MMTFIHDRTDFKNLISALSNELKIEPQLVEKDYWIMHALWGLQNCGFAFELKGGTSLSKGWHCIDRFSEDIDIQIHPPPGSSVPTGKNQDKPKQIEERKKYFQQLSEKISIPGFTSVVRDLTFDDTHSMRNAGIRLIYPNLFGQVEGLKDGILLEVGFDQTTPNETLTISSWMYDKSVSSKVEVKDNRALNVKCYVPEYTFVEKLQTISTKFRKQQETGEMPLNFMRHYYDIFQLLKLSRVQNFIGSKDYLEHKIKRFRSKDETDLTKNEAFLLSNQKTKNQYQEAFSISKNLYFKGQPSLDEVLAELSKWLIKL